VEVGLEMDRLQRSQGPMLKGEKNDGNRKMKRPADSMNVLNQGNFFSVLV
jgi:hypothetical protein